MNEGVGKYVRYSHRLCQNKQVTCFLHSHLLERLQTLGNTVVFGNKVGQSADKTRSKWVRKSRCRILKSQKLRFYKTEYCNDLKLEVKCTLSGTPYFCWIENVLDRDASVTY